MVMILNTSTKIKAVNLCDRLVEYEVNFTFAVVGAQYTVQVEEKDVNFALGGN